MSERTFIRYFVKFQEDLKEEVDALADLMGCQKITEVDATGINDMSGLEKRERRYWFDSKEKLLAFHKAVGPIYRRHMADLAEQMGQEIGVRSVKPGDKSWR